MDGSRPEPGWRIQQFRRYIDLRLTDADFRLPEVAKRFRVSDRYVRRVFERSNEKVSQYVLRRRLELSARLLRNSDLRNFTILSIALECGFSGAAHFSRCFRRHFGTMPSAFRKAPPAG
jgi:AraC-like DNA-binding protein